ncbi:MAG: SUF system Fe-S cluster assembly regulator [Deltaproteobacteria bacterium]|nr:SUF system Fe-S cluster assembly regulator [Deltaproteobacteria bacterium]
MIRLSKITDYGILILAELARTQSAQPTQGLPEGPSYNARELAGLVQLPLPMVSKVLKRLTRAGILESQRGAQGGYTLARHSERVTVSEIIGALEGPVALTECSAGPQVCDHEANCSVRSPLLVVNQFINNALAGITLSDLTQPGFAAQLAPLDRLAQVQTKANEPVSISQIYPNEPNSLLIEKEN